MGKIEGGFTNDGLCIDLWFINVNSHGDHGPPIEFKFGAFNGFCKHGLCIDFWFINDCMGISCVVLHQLLFSVSILFNLLCHTSLMYVSNLSTPPTHLLCNPL